MVQHLLDRNRRGSQRWLMPSLPAPLNHFLQKMLSENSHPIKMKRRRWLVSLVVICVCLHIMSRRSPRTLEEAKSTQSSNQSIPSQDLRWLHVPKTGSSFGNTLAFWACPELPDKNLFDDLEISYSLLGGPLSESCKERIAAKFLPGHDGPYVDPTFLRASAMGGNVPKRRKQVVNNMHVPLPKDITPEELSSTLALFRQPQVRLVSHYFYRHRQFVNSPEKLELVADPDKACNWILQRNFLSMATRMMLGYPRYVKAPIHLTPVDADTACKRVKQFGFIGITDYWEASICLFHAQFGGEQRSAELLNTRQNPSGVDKKTFNYVKQGLPPACNDSLDLIVFSCAADTFMTRIQKYSQCYEILQRSLQEEEENNRIFDAG